ncbi:S24/S26 family peptidase [Fibrobacter sp.]|uniref:S24/S26 family peptidase n=1 Tax=Fibrobacter sp. TaxID=35828 RepID=UPI00388D069A
MPTDEQILSEAIRLVGEGVQVTLPVNGRSMYPFIVGGRESVVLVKPLELRVGYVVLAQVEGGRHVVHRIVGIDDDRITLMGDGNLQGREHCKIDGVKALAVQVVGETGKKRPLYGFCGNLCAKIWYTARPVRRYLLKIFRVVKGL